MNKTIISLIKEKHASIKAIVQIILTLLVFYAISYFLPFIREGFLRLSNLLYGASLIFSGGLGVPTTPPPWVPYVMLSILTIIFTLLSYPTLKEKYEKSA